MAKAITQPKSSGVTSIQTFNDDVYNTITKDENKDKLSKLFDFAEKVSDDILKEVNANGNVLKFEERGRYILVALGVEDAVIKGDKTTVAKLLDREGTEYINWDRMLVSAVQQLKQVPQMIVIDYVDDVTGQKGTYKKIKVSTINPDDDSTPF